MKINYKTTNYSSKTPCPHGMRYSQIPGIGYCGKSKEVVHVGSWVCTHCPHYFAHNEKKQFIICDLDNTSVIQ